MPQKSRILVIDDDPDILDAIKLTLEDEGYEVNTSSKPITLNKYDLSNLPGLIILDVLLSGSDGREVSRNLKSNPLTKKIPLILISADTAARKNFQGSMADDFISKPFDINDLLEKVKKYLKN